MPKRVEFEIVPRPAYRGDEVRLLLIEEPYGQLRRQRQFTVPLSALKLALKAAEILETKEVLVERAENGSEVVALATMYAGLLQVSRSAYGERLFNEIGTKLRKALGLTSK